MMVHRERLDATLWALPGNASAWIALLAVFGVLASVWLVVKLGTDPDEQRRLPEEARLAGFTLLLPSGPWIGIDIDTGEERRGGTGGAPGLVVSRVMVGSPAAIGGIMAGDVVERVDGVRTHVPGDIMKVLSKHRVGDTVSVTIRRGGRSQKLHLRLGARPMGTLAAAAGRERTWLGADVQGIDELLARQLGLPDTRGVVISWVYPGSPAFEAGLAQGDVIRRIGETRLRGKEQLSTLFAGYRPGDPMRMVVWRKGVQKEVKVILAAVPPPGRQPTPTLPEAEVEIEAAWLGLDIVPLTKAEAEELGLPAGLRGMVVDGVATGAGIDAGFQAGDVIVAVNGMKTPTVGAFEDATQESAGAVVDVIRYGRHIYISVPPPGGATDPANGKPPVSQVSLRLW